MTTRHSPIERQKEERQQPTRLQKELVIRKSGFYTYELWEKNGLYSLFVRRRRGKERQEMHLYDAFAQEESAVYFFRLLVRCCVSPRHVGDVYRDEVGGDGTLGDL